MFVILAAVPQSEDMDGISEKERERERVRGESDARCSGGKFRADYSVVKLVFLADLASE